jgi:plasmid stability protein
MSTTLTIRNLEEPVKQMLRMQAARHGRSMEAEARDILTAAVRPPAFAPAATALQTTSRSKSACDSVRGMWAGRMTTDEIMTLTRGDR